MILTMPHDLFTLGNSNRHNDPALQALVQRDLNSKSYPTYPPIFFPNEADSDMSKLFQSVPLMKVSYCSISNDIFFLILPVISSGPTSYSFRYQCPYQPGLRKAKHKWEALAGYCCVEWIDCMCRNPREFILTRDYSVC